MRLIQALTIIIMIGGLGPWASGIVAASTSQIKLRGVRSHLGQTGHQYLQKLLRQRGWKLAEDSSNQHALIQVTLGPAGKVHILQGRHRRTFHIPKHYQSMSVRARSVVTFLDLFTEMDALPSSQQSQNSQQSQHSQRSYYAQHQQQGALPIRARAARRKRRRRASRVKKRVVRKVVARKEPEKKQQKRQPPKRSLRKGRRVAQAAPTLITQPAPWLQRQNPWSFGLEGGLQVSLQKLPGVPVGGWVQVQGGWNWLSLRLEGGFDIPAGVQVQDGGIYRFHFSPTLGFQFWSRWRHQLALEAGGSIEWVLANAQGQSAPTTLRGGFVFALRYHYPLPVQKLWLVGRLAFSVFPQPYQFLWQDTTLYEAGWWHLSLSVGLRFRLL